MVDMPSISGMTPDEVRSAVRARYGRIATDPEAPTSFPHGRAFAEAIGYPPDLLDRLPPAASASFAGVAALSEWQRQVLSPGATVLDLGCGAGLDTLIAALGVGPNGQVIGIDDSPDMTALTRANATAAGLRNVRVIDAPVEAIPLPDAVADAICANGIVNLAPEKERLVAEIARLLKPGATLTAAEIVLAEEIPQGERATIDDWFR